MKKYPKIKNQQSQTLIEVVIATGIIVVVLVGCLSLAAMTIKVGRITKEKNQAINLAQEGIEAVRNIRDTNWLLVKSGFAGATWDGGDPDVYRNRDNIDNSQKGVIYNETENKWEFNRDPLDESPGYNPKLDYFDVNLNRVEQSDAKFKREINITDISGEEKKKVTVTVSWDGEANQVKTVSYLTNWVGVEISPPSNGNGGGNPLLAIDIGAGTSDSFAVKSDGTVWGWGMNWVYGQLGDGTDDDRFEPVQVKGPGGIGFLTDIVAIFGSSDYNSFAIKDDGIDITLWAWGSNDNGQLGDNSKTKRWTPVQVKGPGGIGYLTNIKDVSGGYNDSYALKHDGTVWSWGLNDLGQLGIGAATDPYFTPVQVVAPKGSSGFLTGITDIQAGKPYYCHAVKDDGTVWGWGDNGSYQAQALPRLGIGGGPKYYYPTQVKGPGGSGYLTDVKAIEGGLKFTIVLKNNGEVWGWGSNEYGQLGTGTIDDNIKYPVQVQGPGGIGYLTDIVAISAGEYHCLAIKDEGNDGIDITVWAWGRNNYGQLGTGTTDDNIKYPVQVQDPGAPSGYLTNVKAIVGGSFGHSIALKNDDTVWVWGNNGWGELGNGTTDPSYIPIQVNQ